MLDTKTIIFVCDLLITRANELELKADFNGAVALTEAATEILSCVRSGLFVAWESDDKLRSSKAMQTAKAIVDKAIKDAKQ